MIDFYVNLSPNLKASLIITLFLIVSVILIGKRVERLKPTDKPGKFLFVIVMLVDMLNNQIKDFYGKNWKTFAPLLIAVLLYLALANTSSLVGLANPLANVGVALSFSIFAFLTIQISGLMVRKPWNRLKDLSSPTPLLLPLNLISEISTPLAMGLRLFGNLLSGSVMAVVVFNLLNTVFAGIATTLVLHPIFNLGFGLIQAFVFYMLLTIFLSMAIEEPELETES